MDISITGVTAQRKFLKTCVRLQRFLEPLRRCCADVVTTSESFDILQLVFMDRPESFLSVEGTQNGDRLFQIHVGIGLERDFGLEHDHSFLCLVADQVLRAVQASPLGLDLRGKIVTRVEYWRGSLTERLDEAHTPSA
jgi:hypothetical protein